MGTRYLVDTNIAIYFLHGALSENARTFLRPILDKECVLSIVGKIELLGWQFPSPEDEAKATAFIEDSTILPLTDAVADKAIELRKTTKSKLGDAIIAATPCFINWRCSPAMKTTSKIYQA
jgi:toxin FitB